MDLGLRGSQVLITGASAGIGAAVAKTFAAEGANIVLVARRADELKAVAEEIGGQFSVKVDICRLDMSVSGSAQHLAREFPLVDIVVNNAGSIPFGTLDQIDERQWRDGWELKVFGYINVTREYYDLMKARGAGVIINVIGTSGDRFDPRYICGSVGNAALIAFTRTLGSVSARDGIRVVGINPGPILTARLAKFLRGVSERQLGDPDRWQELSSSMPFGRYGTVEEIAAMAAFLASDLSGYVSGTIVTVDGGFIVTEVDK